MSCGALVCTQGRVVATSLEVLIALLFEHHAHLRRQRWVDGRRRRRWGRLLIDVSCGTRCGETQTFASAGALGGVCDIMSTRG